MTDIHLLPLLPNRPRTMPNLLADRRAAGWVKKPGQGWVYDPDYKPAPVVKPESAQQDPSQQVVTVTDPRSQPPTTFRPGHVGGGRPKGSKNKLSQKLINNVDGILDIMIAKAKEGDVAAATLVVNRAIPVLRPQSEKVQFVLHVDESISHQVGQVLLAISKGEVAADVGKKIMESIMMLHQARAMEDLSKRIEQLEAKQI